MEGGLNRREPTNAKRVHQHPPLVNIFLRHHWMGFFEQLKGYDDDITQEFSMAVNTQGEDSVTTIARGLVISLNVVLISILTTLPLGIQWSKEDKVVSDTTMNNFFIQRENLVEDKNVLRREILPYSLDEVAYIILKYISCEGRLIILYSYHFRLLHEIRFKEKLPSTHRLSVPHFLLQFIIEMNQKVREGNHQHISYHELIKMIIMDL